MNDMERRLLDAATSEEERDAIRRIMEHERRVNHARSIETFLQGLSGILAGMSKQADRMRKQSQADAGLLVIKVCATAFLLLGAYLMMAAVIQ